MEEGTAPHPHKPRLLLLRADNRLEQLDLVSGRLLRSLFLSHNFRFTDLSLDSERGWLVLTSVKLGGAKARHLGGEGQQVLKAVLVVEQGSLDLLHHFTVSKTLFGSDVCDAELVMGLLLIMRHNRTIEAYSLESLLALGSPLPPPSPPKEPGLPLTLQLTSCSPVLWQCRSLHHHLELHEQPWLYLRAQARAGGGGEELGLHLLATHQQVSGGRVGRDPEEQEHLTFHPDGSARLLHTGPSGLQVYYLQEEGGQVHLKQQFSYNPAPPQQAGVGEGAREERTRGGRLVRRQVASMVEEQVTSVSYCYEDDLDVLGVVVSRESVEEEESNSPYTLTSITEVRLYQTTSMQLLRTIPLDLVSIRSSRDLRGEVSLHLDLNVMTISVKSEARTRVWVFRLGEEEDSEGSVKTTKVSYSS